ncbi:hypothetical protein X965_11265 [Morganella sp. EGD-HP17]|nr:hypothetical protein X965_11265 [Morganella sp. EGD-HP17]
MTLFTLLFSGLSLIFFSLFFIAGLLAGGD